MQRDSTRAAGAEPADGGKRHRLTAVLGSVASVVILCVALWFLHRELAGLSHEAIVAHIRSIPLSALLGAVGFAAGSYAVLTLYDVVALRHFGLKQPYSKAALTAFMAYAVGHNVGLVALSGGSIRYRLYSLAGLSAADIAGVIVFITVTFGLGASGLIGIALWLLPAADTAVLQLPATLLKSLGTIFLAVPVLYVLMSLLRRAPLEIGDWRVSIPRPPIAVAQLVISIADLACAAATLYIILAPVVSIGFLQFLGIYLLALAAGLLSSIPGGIGVFEAVLIAALPQVSTSALLGTIIVYRLIYYVAPLIVALFLLAGHEARQHGRLLKKASRKIGDLLSVVAPQVLAVIVFLAGVVLLVSGASPAVEARLSLIARGIPLPVLELSHLAGSVIGMALLILARGLYQRLHGAFVAALAAIAAGIVVSLVKGLDYEEASILAAIAVGLWLSRDEFYRRESIGVQRFSLQWIVAIVLVICVVVWVGLVSYRHVEYSNELWWQFAFDAEAPRMLRASLLAVVTAVVFALWKVFRTGPVPVAAGDESPDFDQVRKVLATASNASANVALLGDKRFLWSADKSAFVMYQVRGRSWIAMGDPVGPPGCREELAWAFRELVDRHNGRPVFYEVRAESLALYVDLGLTLSKLGEDASVPLDGFSLEGSEHAEMRHAVNRATRAGAMFEVIPRAGVPEILPELRAVSDAWLAEKSTAEKGFSLGCFTEAYIANFDCAVVRVDQRIVAFANLWPAPAGGELSIDLMRYDSHAPKGVMDYLFVQLMVWGAANGYRRFNLGMAPLAGLERRSLAPLWHRVGHLVFTHGENFYNFEGLRNYKQKFNPEWKPRYLACAGGWANLPRSLFDASRLISGGVGGILGRA